MSKGIADLERGVESIESLVVSIGAPRLAPLGFSVPTPIASPEHRLYEFLSAEEPDTAHSRYNALVRRLDSFERAAERADSALHVRTGRESHAGAACYQVREADASGGPVRPA